MKRKCLLLMLAVIATIGASAQTAQVMPLGVDSLVLDKVNYRITYTGKAVNDTTTSPYVYTQAEMRLDIGSKVCYFYNQSNVRVREQVKAMIMSGGGIDMAKVQPVKCMTWQYIKNYPKVGKSYFQEIAGSTNCLCEEDVEVPEWQLIADSTATIIGYECRLAKTDFKGRTWYAWYTDDIPMNEGPWKLCGLPGLILRAYDAQKQYIFEGIGLENIKGKEDMKFAYPHRAEKVSQKEITRLKKIGVDTSALAAEGAKAYDPDGKPIDIKKWKPKVQAFNPIERDTL